MRPLTGTPNLEPVEGYYSGWPFIYLFLVLFKSEVVCRVCSVCFVSSVFVVTARLQR